MRKLLALLVICPFVYGSSLTAGDIPGLVKEKPAEGPAVKTDQGYMVPYKATIPGTDVEFEMVPIPGGTFKVGSPESEADRDATEGPQFEVTVQPFWMGKYEITWSEYKKFMDLYSVFKTFESKKIRPVTAANKVDAITAPTELYDPSFTFEFGEEPRQPAVTMTQYAAKQYTKWLSAITGQFYRLPGEAEWEYACRAGSDTAYSFGDDPSKLDEYAWYYDNSDDTTHDVGEKKPNKFGLYDMHGNVAELVLDELLEDGYARFKGKKVTAEDATVWPKTEYPRVAKGGSWEDDPDACRCAARVGTHAEEWKSEDPNLPLSPYWFTSDPSRGVGFRIMRPLTPPKDREKYWEADHNMIRMAVDNRLSEGRGAIGVVDKELPAAIKKLQDGQ